MDNIIEKKDDTELLINLPRVTWKFVAKIRAVTIISVLQLADFSFYDIMLLLRTFERVTLELCSRPAVLLRFV